MSSELDPLPDRMAEHSPNPSPTRSRLASLGAPTPRFDSLASRRPTIRLAIAMQVDMIASSTPKSGAEFNVPSEFKVPPCVKCNIASR
eukprot:4063238-Alexandrium_andersonii.AAC.1